MENQWIDALRAMGPVASGITVVHLLMSVVVVAIVAGKLFGLRKRADATRRFADGFVPLLKERDIDGALAHAESCRDSQVALVLGAALRSAHPFLYSQGRSEYAASVADVAAEREQTLLSSALRRGLSSLATIGATATLLGLLGTVVGIMNAFTAMARAGGGSIDTIAGGIGEALLTTALGLIVAVPAVWAYTYLNGRLDRLFSELDAALQELLEWILVHDEPEVTTTFALPQEPGAVLDGRSGTTRREPALADVAGRRDGVPFPAGDAAAPGLGSTPAPTNGRLRDAAADDGAEVAGAGAR